MSEKIGSRFAWTSSSRLLAAVIQAVTLVLLARWTSPAVFGVVAAVLAVASVAQVAFAFGIQTSVVRERARDPHSPLIFASLRLNDQSALLLAVVFGALIGLASLIDPLYLQLLPLAVWISTSRNSETWLSIVFADGDVWINAANQVVTRTLALGLFVGLYVANIAPVLAYSISYAVVWLASSVYAHVLVRRRVVVPDRRPTIREVLTHSKPFWMHSLATQGRQLDVVVAALFTTPVQAGYYALASRLVRPFRTLTTSLAAVLLPSASRRGSFKVVRRIRKLIWLTFLVTTALYVVGALILPWLVPILLGDEYEGAVLTLQVTVLSLSFGAVVPLLSSVLQGVGLMRFVATISWASTALCLLLVAVGAAAGGAVGAAVGLGVSFVVQAVALALRLEILVRRGEGDRD